ncbi:hypothetical protein DFJ66_6703 [Saccharothrix variisporea]|uniref:Uncharacterized protein n=1 Tax=Saccharothrix variisporea TaxID=543527 RepID=A0A495XFZ2_9PSEU|nr:hypothetical protein DFJ66_6703 [Saccharothrix variisporea]
MSTVGRRALRGLAPAVAVVVVAAGRVAVRGGAEVADAATVKKLLVHAFLNDLRTAYGTDTFRLRRFRRTTYPLVLLDNVTEDNVGVELLHLINDVRKETPAHAPLLVVATLRERPEWLTRTGMAQPVHRIGDDLDAWVDRPNRKRLLGDSMRVITVVTGRRHTRRPDPPTPGPLARTPLVRGRGLGGRADGRGRDAHSPRVLHPAHAHARAWRRQAVAADPGPQPRPTPSSRCQPTQVGVSTVAVLARVAVSLRPENHPWAIRRTRKRQFFALPRWQPPIRPPDRRCPRQPSSRVPW